MRTTHGSIVALAAIFAIGGMALAATAWSARSSHPGQNGLVAYVKREPPCIGSACAETIWVSSLDGRNARRVSPLRGKNSSARHPTWSPDGRWIAYFDMTGGGSPGTKPYVFELWVVRPDGSGRRRILTHADRAAFAFDRPSWTPDGRELVVRFTGSSNELWAIDVRTRETRRLVTLPVEAKTALLSPNGKLVAFVDWAPFSFVSDGVRFENKERFLFVMRADGKDKRRIGRVGGGFHDDFGDWSPDSSHLVVLPDEGDRPSPTSRFVIVNALGGAPRLLVQRPEPVECSADKRGGCTVGAADLVARRSHDPHTGPAVRARSADPAT